MTSRVLNTEIALPIIVGTVAIHLGKKVGKKGSYRSSQLLPDGKGFYPCLQAIMSACPSPCLGPC